MRKPIQKDVKRAYEVKLFIEKGKGIDEIASIFQLYRLEDEARGKKKLEREASARARL